MLSIVKKVVQALIKKKINKSLQCFLANPAMLGKLFFVITAGFALGQIRTKYCFFYKLST